MGPPPPFVDESSVAFRPAVWITRAEPGARDTAHRVAALGFGPVVAPLLTFQPIEAVLTLEPGEALAFTSISGVHRTAALLSDRQTQVFAVGDATAAAAREAGFINVASAGGDVEALSTLINQHKWRGGVVHPCATETAGDLMGALRAQGIAARKVAVYQTQAAAALPPAVHAALEEGRLRAALFHSPKAARTVADLDLPSGAFAPVVGVGLSPACINPLAGSGFKALQAAREPTEAALLATLADMMADADGG